MKRHHNSDDEEDSCVLVGTPLADLLPEDAKFSVKAKRPDEQIVTDEKGRQRFHGAFTGGFSAGYFNSVGTKEGWAPATFKSSRSDRAEQKRIRPEDFMDEEDFSEHGIAPKVLKIKSDFKETLPSSEAGVSVKANTADFIFDHLIKPVSSTVGVRMLRKMGWREGQGIGPKIKKKLRKLKSKIAHEPGRKIYGVALPSESDESEIEMDDEYLVGTFDINEFQFEIKEDLFGLGYKRLDVGNLFIHNAGNQVEESPAASLLFPMMKNQTKVNKKAISGQAFGYGEFEDEEDVDIYKQDSIETYDFGLDSKSKNDAKKMLNKTYGFGAFDNDISVLKRFIESKNKQQPAKVFPAPQVPQNFNLFHKLPKTSVVEAESSSRSEKDPMNMYLKSATERAEVLGESFIKPDSVFDLISPADREFLMSQKSKTEKSLDEPKEPKETQPIKESDKEKKAKRYESFVSFIKKNYKDPYSFVETSSLTEWEKEQEKDEFFRKYEEQMKKIESIKKDSLRFVSTSLLNEQNQETEIKKDNDKEAPVESAKETEALNEVGMSEFQKAAKEKKFGKLTRVEYEWRPHPVLCRRFNVPNPFPDAKEYGTVKNEYEKSKSTKFSMFNVLTASSRFDKSKSLFDEINANVAVKEGPSHAKTIILDKSEKSTSKIEFEKKESGESATKSDFSSIISDKNDKKTVESKKAENEEPNTLGQNKNNVYLQERPSVDLFKAIFEDEDEEEENNEEKKESENEEEEEEENEKMEHSEEVNEKTTIVPSSFSQINVNDVNKYLNYTKDEDDYEKANAKVKEDLPEAIKFTKLVKSLASKSSKADSSSESCTSSSSSSDSDVEEIVYEEVSIDSSKKPKKSHKKKSSSSSKKKKKHKKKKKSSKKNH